MPGQGASTSTSFLALSHAFIKLHATPHALCNAPTVVAVRIELSMLSDAYNPPLCVSALRLQGCRAVLTRGTVEVFLALAWTLFLGVAF